MTDLLACARPTPRYPAGRTGTRAGWHAHQYAGEPKCAPCSEGNRRMTNDDRDTERHLRYNLQRKYRLTLERYLQMLAEQGGCCAICGSDDPGDVRAGRFHVDHDHSCCPGDYSCGSCIRGLLCRGCNTALGNFADDRARLLRAAEYLARAERPRENA